MIRAANMTSRSKPMPVTCWPWKSAPSRRNEAGSRSMTATECPARPSCRARDDPTRPHPMITMCTPPPAASKMGSSAAVTPGPWTATAGAGTGCRATSWRRAPSSVHTWKSRVIQAAAL